MTAISSGRCIFPLVCLLTPFVEDSYLTRPGQRDRQQRPLVPVIATAFTSITSSHYTVLPGTPYCSETTPNCSALTNCCRAYPNAFHLIAIRAITHHSLSHRILSLPLHIRPTS